MTTIARVSSGTFESSSTLGFVVSLVLLWSAGAALRLTVLALPPVLDPARSALALSPIDVGVLTAIPSFAFAVGAIPGAMLIGRIGATSCLVLGLVVTALGAAARGFVGGTLALEIATAVMCVGIAAMQPAMPVLVRQWAPRQIGFASATYTFGLLVGEIAPVTWPLHASIGSIAGGWRSQLFVWSLPIVATALAVAVFRMRTAPSRVTGSDASPWPDWKRGETWWIGLLMGSIGAVYLGLNGFIPGWLNRAGARGETGSALMALNIAQLPAVFIMMRYAEKLAFRGWVYAIAGAGLLASSVLLATGAGPGVAVVAVAGVAGFCSAILLSLVLTLQPLVAANKTLAALSAGTFTIGFFIAGAVALLTGWLDRAGPGWLSVLPIAIACATIMGVGAAIKGLRPHRLPKR